MNKKILCVATLCAYGTMIYCAQESALGPSDLVSQGIEDLKILRIVDSRIKAMSTEEDRAKLTEHAQKLYDQFGAYIQQNPQTLIKNTMWVNASNFEQELEMLSKSELFNNKKTLILHNQKHCRLVREEIAEIKKEFRSRYLKLVALKKKS